MNINKLSQLIDGGVITKAHIIRQTGISRPALDSILDGNDFKVSNLEKLSRALNKPIGYFFDEEGGVRTEGAYSSASDSGNVSVVVGDAVLAERIKALESLIAEKDERITELKERIEELKQR